MPRVREVVLMGGGVHVGNWNATSEFNIVVDPEAAHIVFNESWPLTMVGLDVTHQALATPEVRGRASPRSAPRRRGSSASCSTSSATYLARRASTSPGARPVAVAYVIDPALLRT